MNYFELSASSLFSIEGRKVADVVYRSSLKAEFFKFRTKRYIKLHSSILPVVHVRPVLRGEFSLGYNNKRETITQTLNSE